MITRCFKVVIIVFIMVMTTSCNPCFFATSSCNYPFDDMTIRANNDIEYFVKNNTTNEQRIDDFRSCLSVACPEIYKLYQLPDEKGKYQYIIKKYYDNKYNDNAVKSTNCIGDNARCMLNNKGYSTKW